MVFDPDRQLPGGAFSTQEQMLDAMIRHQIGLLRVNGSIRNDVLAKLDESEIQVRAAMNRTLASVRRLRPRELLRLQRMLDQIEEARAEAWATVCATLRSELRAISVAEPDMMARILRTVAPTILDPNAPPTATLRRLVTQIPIQGQTLTQHLRSLRLADMQRINAAVRAGLVQRFSPGVIARSVLGSRGTGGRNGVTQIARNHLTTLVRTAVNHVSNQARREFVEQNRDLIRREMWVATLDGRTTLICQDLDGKQFRFDEGPTPPIHPN